MPDATEQRDLAPWPGCLLFVLALAYVAWRVLR
jgi:hypothetical protein